MDNRDDEYTGWFSTPSRMDVNGTWVIRFHNEKVETAVHEWL